VENAPTKELREMGLEVAQQKTMKVAYGGEPVGEFIADLLVERTQCSAPVRCVTCHLGHLLSAQNPRHLSNQG